MITLVRAVQTCSACPSQWDAWDSEGNYLYLRYRWGYGAAYRDAGDPDHEAVAAFDTGDEFDGVISLEEFCERAGLKLTLTYA